MEISLSNSPCKAIVDDEDYERLKDFNWMLKRQTVFRNRGIKNRFSGRTKYYHTSLANEVMNDYTKRFDHKDRNPFNNRKTNIRDCNQKQNSQNRTKSLGKSSNYKGVSWHRRAHKWVAYIYYTSRTTPISLGYFGSEKEAALAYNEKAKELFKEFAVLNVV